MDTKITFHLNEQMVKLLKEEFESTGLALKKFADSDNEGANKSLDNKEAKKLLAKVNNLLSKLDNGGEFVCKNEALKDKDDIEDFIGELAYLIECCIGVL